MKAPIRWTTPARMAINAINPVTLSSPSSLVKNVVARSERNRGDRPKSDMLTPEAIPMYSGKFFDAANNEEKYLKGK